MKFVVLVLNEAPWYPHACHGKSEIAGGGRDRSFLEAMIQLTFALVLPISVIEIGDRLPIQALRTIAAHTVRSSGNTKTISNVLRTATFRVWNRLGCFSQGVTGCKVCCCCSSEVSLFLEDNLAAVDSKYECLQAFLASANRKSQDKQARVIVRGLELHVLMLCLEVRSIHVDKAVCTVRQAPSVITAAALANVPLVSPASICDVEKRVRIKICEDAVYTNARVTKYSKFESQRVVKSFLVADNRRKFVTQLNRCSWNGFHRRRTSWTNPVLSVQMVRQPVVIREQTSPKPSTEE